MTIRVNDDQLTRRYANEYTRRVVINGNQSLQNNLTHYVALSLPPFYISSDLNNMMAPVRNPLSPLLILLLQNNANAKILRIPNSCYSEFFKLNAHEQNSQ